MMGKLLTADINRIGQPAGQSDDGCAPDWVAGGTPQPLRDDLIALLGERVILHRAIDLIRYASDASPYRRIPKVVVLAEDEQSISKLLRYARLNGEHITFRSGGTSLNGQGQTEGILVDVRRNFAGMQLLEQGRAIKLKPGTVLGVANRLLARHGYRLGPDPASSDFATVGGVVANNSGGMRCGTTYDSYQTITSMRLVTASGNSFDTAAADAEQRFAELEPELAAGLLEIRDLIRADQELSARITKKFSIKNTTGYRLCAFLDADTPLEIFRRLVVGSEGTLAFVAEASFKTRPLPRKTSVGWLHFPSVDAAIETVPSLVEFGATAVELMGALALIAASHMMPNTPEYWKELPVESAALLVEFGGDDVDQLHAQEQLALDFLKSHELLQQPTFTHDHEQVEAAWHVREGLFGLVGKIRPAGTALIVEDVCVEPKRIAECTKDIQALLGKYSFLTGVAGHASAGNLHFQLTPAFDKPEDRDRYEAFMAELVELIVDRYDGSLKAEHGTGINMAPWVQREWGDKATELMWRIKQLADPHNLLAPGVVLNRDPNAHLEGLQTLPEVEESVNLCVECGACEPVCPSRNVTTTPRQRIVIRREMARQPEGSPLFEALLADYDYEALQTCAADSSCATACPLGIDTGSLVKEFRGRQHGEREERFALKLAQRWESVERLARGGLRAGKLVERVVGSRGVAALPNALRKRVSEDVIPTWPTTMPAAARQALPHGHQATAAAVYMPACINRIFGNSEDTDQQFSLPEALVLVSQRAGLPLWIPEDVAGNCCSTPWNSKGYQQGSKLMAKRTATSILRWTDNGRLPLVSDASSCSQGLVADIAPLLEDEDLKERFSRVKVLDSTAWVHDYLLPKLTITERVSSVALHPTCATSQLGLTAKLNAVAERMAERVVTPASSSCCGMAGDRGMLHPELPASALRDSSRELNSESFDAYLCSNRTCEIGLSEQTGQPYGSFIHLLEKLTRS